MSDSARMRTVWHPTRAFAAAIIVGLLLLGVAVVASRPDIGCFGVPLVLWAALRWQGRPRSPGESGIRISAENPDRTHGGLTVPFTLRVDAAEPARLAQLRVRTGGVEDHELMLSARHELSLRGRMPALHSGPVTVAEAQLRLFTADGAFFTAPSEPVAVGCTIPPVVRPLSRLLLPARLQGLSGSHESARPGDGGEFRDIHPFAPGDRLRRVDWKATARLSRRPGDLYVRRTSALSDASIVLVMDSGTDVGEVVAEWPDGDPRLTGTLSLDLAREAAASLATAYVENGDQVAFHDLSLGAPHVRRGSGARHLARLRAAIAATRAHGTSWLRRRAPVLPTGALVYVISPFLDDEAGRLAGMWRASGHRVIAIDVLPEPVRDRLTREQATAHRILMLERGDRLGALEAVGVELLRWGSDAEVEASLLALSRRRRA
ncbi:Uncharacterized conserved protein, DUF58 family, contains vWF domain [Paramicrobacterium humi]|uniref:Uncharacterized conserved protein, DUF58 family, contains vWF domain n=1 Tax=Paramicrobacterium humi TaxID=640635 RepID=A0A1H4QYF3_9MICO|nr:DUF58 domain-containing protein [Microbacterium humi]SEC24622.1 Uncharacterized conserved protein, DUF58 family, contains vWF domain [Microbacterium humi]